MLVGVVEAIGKGYVYGISHGLVLTIPTFDLSPHSPSGLLFHLLRTISLVVAQALSLMCSEKLSL
jgi:hypothetical protein